MAQTGYTPIQLYYSSTATNAPAAGNLAYGELAINITDGKLFYKDNANAVQVIGWKVVPATAGGTGQTSYAVGDILYASTTTALSKLADVATGNALISGGVNTAPAWGKIGLTTHISGTLPIANGGTNQTAFTGKSGNVAGLVFFDGTSLANDATVTDVGYDTSTNTVTVNNFSASGTATNLQSAAAGFSAFIGKNTSTSATTAKYVQYLLQGTDTISGLKNVAGLRATPNDNNWVTTWLDVYVNAADVWTLSTRFGPGVSIGTTTNPGAGNLIVNGTTQTGTTIGVGAATPATSGAGITFPATQSASSNANTLDDYEEGTWTPVISQNGTGSLPFTTTSVTGTYTKIGNYVIAYCSYVYSDRGSGNNGFYSFLSGYPYSTSSTKGTAYVAILQGSADTNQYFVSMNQDTASFNKNNYNGGAGAMIKSDFPASGTLLFTVCYTI